MCDERHVIRRDMMVLHGFTCTKKVNSVHFYVLAAYLQH